ncbi:MAG: membrane fusion protein (multidrug efflux system), partial [Flavobacteriales bacterium]
MSNKSVSTAPTSTSTFTSRLPLFILVAILVSLIIYLQWPEA